MQTPTEKTSTVTSGVVLVVIGLILLGAQFHWIDTWRLSRLWPLILIAIGTVRFASTPVPGEHRQGAGLIFVGSILLLHSLDILMIWDSWPLFIVGFGVSMLTGARARDGRREAPNGHL